MTENWLTPTLCSFDEKVRVERGPQVVDLVCCEKNLSDDVTHGSYQVGKRDALGRIIRPDLAGEYAVKQARIDKQRGIESLSEGDTMACVDHKAAHAPYLWKIYQLQDFEELNQKTGDYETVSRFIKVDEVEGKEDALIRARAVRKEMN